MAEERDGQISALIKGSKSVVTRSKAVEAEGNKAENSMRERERERWVCSRRRTARISSQN